MTQQYLPILDNLAVGIIHVDKFGTTLMVNTAVEQFFEISRQRIIGRSLFSWMHEQEHSLDPEMPPQDDVEHLPLREMVKVVLSHHQPLLKREAIFTVANQASKKADYSVAPVASAIYNDINGVLIELTPLKRFNQISREKQLAEQRKLAQMMIRGIAHELKNPLGGIRGAAQLLARQIEKIDPSLLEYTHVIEKEADRLKALVEPMLGNQQVNQEWVNIHEPIEHVLRLVRNQINKSSPQGAVLQLKRDYDLSLPELFIDRNQMVQVLLNICINAKQAIEESGLIKTAGYQPVITLKTRVERCMTILGVQHRQVMRIDIIDNGPGIAEHLQDTLFFPMMTSRAEGTGLGLSIAQDIVQYHGGLIACQSTTGNTVFTIFLPWETPKHSSSQTHM